MWSGREFIKQSTLASYLSKRPIGSIERLIKSSFMRGATILIVTWRPSFFAKSTYALVNRFPYPKHNFKFASILSSFADL